MNNTVSIGDLLIPDPLYNQSERGNNRLPVPTKVIGKKSAVCQSGIMLQVQNIGGQKTWLDAGWFLTK